MEENKLGRKRSCLQLPTCSPRKLQVLVAGCWQNFSFHKLIYCCWFWNYFRSTGSLVVICFVWQKVQNLERTTHDPFQKCRTCTEKSSHKKLFSRIVVFFFYWINQKRSVRRALHVLLPERWPYFFNILTKVRRYL